MEVSDKQSVFLSRPFIKNYRWAIIFLGACLGGITWRIRGDSALGGSFGMFFVGLVFLLFIALLIPHEGKFTPGLLGVLLVFIGWTTSGYGTFIGQLSGRFYLVGESSYDLAIPAYNGWVWLFLTGFCWVGLFAMIIGMLFSPKSYQIRDIIVGFIIYLIIEYIGKLFIGHLLVPLISPETTTFFAQSIPDPESSPWLLYLQLFFDRSSLNAIPGGRNYGTEVDNVAASIAVLGLVFYLLLMKKDSFAAKMTFVISLIFGLGMMLAAIWQFLGAGGLYTEGVGYAFTPPEWLRIGRWSLWEFTTGFLSLGGTTYVLIHHVIKMNMEEFRSLKPIIPPHVDRWIYFIGFIVLGIAAFFQLITNRFQDALQGVVFEGINYVLMGIGIILTAVVTGRKLFGKTQSEIYWPTERMLWRDLSLILLISVPVYLFLHAYGIIFITRAVHYFILVAAIYSGGFLGIWQKKDSRLQ
jgi:hypothetical protein